MSRRRSVIALIMAAVLSSTTAIAQHANVKVVVADATYVMGDSDTLAGADENVLLRAKRKAIEETGVYIEALFQDVETYSKGTTSRLNSLGVRTIAAAVTETEVLEKRRSLDGDRLVLFVKIRATVHLDMLADAVKRLQSDEQLAEHHRQLHTEYSQLKTELNRLRKQLEDSNKPHSETTLMLKHRRTAAQLVRSAVETHSLPEKIELASRAIAAEDGFVEAYIVRGQTYLRIASLDFSKKSKRTDLNDYVERAIADFDRALTLDPASTWALLGRGDSYTWQKKLEDAAKDYERILALDPLFDVARQRLIALYTTIAKKQGASRQKRQALTTLGKVLRPDTPQSWVAQQKEAYRLRSQIYVDLGEFEHAVDDLTTIIQVDPADTPALLLRARLYRRLLQGRLSKDDFGRACELGSEEACTELQ